MTIATLRSQTQMVASTRDTRARKPTIHVGTFADGQRAEPLTANYSAEIGSFADAQEK